jgi:hypothetical protein
LSLLQRRGDPPPPTRRRLRERFRDAHTRSRRLISEHRQKRKLREREVSPQSRRGLDWANFFMAEVQVGFGSFLAFYLADLGWSKQATGVALAVGGIAGVLFMIPGGAVADAVRWKRGLAALGIIAIATAALVLAVLPSLQSVYAAEALQGIASGVLSPAIAAISLGLAGRHGMSSRIGRNFRYAAAGNAVTAATMGALGAYVSIRAVFAVAAALCVPALVALSYIRPQEIDYLRARNASKDDHDFSVKRLARLGRNRHLLVFAGCMGLFQLANGSLLPLVSEALARRNISSGSLFTGAMVVVSQVVVVLLAPWVGYWSELVGPQATAGHRLWNRGGAGIAVCVHREPMDHHCDSSA